MVGEGMRLGRMYGIKILKKQESAFGDAKAEMCKRKNISSCWTDCASDEDLKKLNDIVGM